MSLTSVGCGVGVRHSTQTYHSTSTECYIVVCWPSQWAWTGGVPKVSQLEINQTTIKHPIWSIYYTDCKYLYQMNTWFFTDFLSQSGPNNKLNIFSKKHIIVVLYSLANTNKWVQQSTGTLKPTQAPGRRQDPSLGEN